MGERIMTKWTNSQQEKQDLKEFRLLEHLVRTHSVHMKNISLAPKNYLHAIYQYVEANVPGKIGKETWNIFNKNYLKREERISSPVLRNILVKLQEDNCYDGRYFKTKR